MTKFNVGDKVKVIRSHFDDQLEGVVTCINTKTKKVEVKTSIGSLYFRYNGKMGSFKIELIEPKFNIGDKVVIVEESINDVVSTIAEGRVSNVNNITNIMQVKTDMSNFDFPLSSDNEKFRIIPIAKIKPNSLSETDIIYNFKVSDRVVLIDRWGDKVGVGIVKATDKDGINITFNGDKTITTNLQGFVELTKLKIKPIVRTIKSDEILEQGERVFDEKYGIGTIVKSAVTSIFRVKFGSFENPFYMNYTKDYRLSIESKSQLVKVLTVLDDLSQIEEVENKISEIESSKEIYGTNQESLGESSLDPITLKRLETVAQALSNMNNKQNTQENKLPTYFRIGDKVKSLFFGEGKVVGVISDNPFPSTIVVIFDNDPNVRRSYTYDGCYTTQEPPTLFQAHLVLPELPKNEPILEFKEGELVWVKDFGATNWHARYYAGSINGKHTVYSFQTKKEKLTSIYFEIKPFFPIPF